MEESTQRHEAPSILDVRDMATELADMLAGAASFIALHNEGIGTRQFPLMIGMLDDMAARARRIEATLGEIQRGEVA